MDIKEWILHDIWERNVDFPHGLERESLESYLRGNKGIFILAEHGRHLHIIHDCTYGGSQCRYAFMRRIGNIPKKSGIHRGETEGESSEEEE